MMEITEKPVVITSLDPDGNVDAQRECFDRWAEIGFETFSVNTSMAARRLQDRGLSEHDIIVSRNLCAKARFFSGAQPKVDSILRIVEERFAERDVLICKPGVFPAIRDASIARFLAKSADIVGLTSELSDGSGSYKFSDCTPNRTDLAAVLVRAKKITSLRRTILWERRREGTFLRRSSWVEKFARQVRSNGLHGLVMDSGLLVEWLPDRPVDNVDFFAQCTFGARMNRRFPGVERDWQEGDDYRLLLDEECCRNVSVTEQLRLIYFSHECNEPPQQDAIARAGAIIRAIGEVVPDLSLECGFSDLARMEPIDGNEGGLMSRLSSIFATSSSHYHNFTQMLLAIAYMLRLYQESGGLPTVDEVTSDRADIVQTLIGTVSPRSPEYRVRVAQVFGSRLIDERRLDEWLLRALVYACENATERALVKDINELSRRQVNVASAY